MFDKYRHFFAHQQPESCARCQFAKHQKRWGAKLPLVPGSPSLGTWLASRVDDDNNWGIGCIACAASDGGSGDAGSFGRFEVNSMPQLVHLQKHARSRRHRQAVKQFGGEVV